MMRRTIAMSLCVVTLLVTVRTFAQDAGTGYPTAESHFDALYAKADGRYVWSNWKGSFNKWQKRFRAELEETLGIPRMRAAMPGFKPEARQLDSEDMGSFFRERWEIYTEPDVLLPVIILRPKEIQGKTGLMITPHGHSKNTELYAGVYWNEQTDAQE